MGTLAGASMRGDAALSRRGTRARALRSSLAIWACAFWPLIAAAVLFRFAIANHFFGYDFQATIYDPGRAVIEGHSPYPSPTLAALIGRPTFVYPPLILWLDVPIALLPLAAAQAVWAVLLVAAVAAGLWLLGVHDWRCYGLALGSVPVLDGLVMGNVTILFVLGLALA
ncbi:MAG TPA: glycosyltransferase 87 family protein, partial [Thermoleophilaceae bacterium]